MFKQNVTLALDNAGTGSQILSLIDGPTNQRTLRRLLTSDGPIDFSIAHQKSTENPGFDTQRSNVRLSFTQVDVETGKEYTVYVQLTISVPTEKVTAALVSDMVARLINFLDTSGEDPASLEGDLSAAIDDTIARLYAGEP